MSALDPLPVRSEEAMRRVAQACDYCTAKIVWTESRNARMPVDLAPVELGNVLVQVSPAGLASSVIASPTQRAALQAAGWVLHQHHKLTCPKADQWSRPSDRSQQRDHLARRGTRLHAR